MAKIFMNGASQAVRLPAEYRFPTKEVYISRDQQSGDVILSTHPSLTAWKGLFELIHSIDAPDEFMSERALNNPPVDKNLFDDL